MLESAEMLSIADETLMTEVSLLFIPSIKRRVVVEELKRVDFRAVAIEIQGISCVPQEVELDAFSLDPEM